MPSEYQQYQLTRDFEPLEIGVRMRKKLHALRNVFPENLVGQTLLDVGCDSGFWCWLAQSRGAPRVLGLDRGRPVKGQYVDWAEENNAAGSEVCEFEKINLGKQWREFGQFDIVLMMSLYHHVYHNTGGDHESIWYWLRRHTRRFLIWENPTDASDSVVRLNVDGALHPGYTSKNILRAASRYFEPEFIGPAEHEPTRQVYKFKPLQEPRREFFGQVVSGAGGASKAFEYANGRRMDEIESILGVRPIPGSMNMRLPMKFIWNRRYYRAQLLDVANRMQGMDSPWKPRWGRFYPVILEGTRAWVFRFEGEAYSDNFVELISDVRLRDRIEGNYARFERL